MRLPPLSALLLVVLASAVQAAPGFDEAPWRAQRIVNGDTLSFWADPGIYDVARNGFMKWDESQSAVRFGCMNCAPSSWGSKEFWQYRMDQMLKEQNPHYLMDLTFFFINVERLGTSTVPMSWRTTAADSMVVTFTDGSRFVSEPPKDLEIISMARKSEGFEMTCRQAKLQLGGQPLLIKAQIDARRRDLAYRYSRFNEFAIPLRIKDPPKNLFSRVQSIRLYFADQPIDLERNDRVLIGAR